ncbi:hypothetical protein QZH41_018576 [Actinostola sp. cb2023]|nr:hypothetical protein QZH41_018576 [Actinostola sp. cb2023]
MVKFGDILRRCFWIVFAAIVSSAVVPTKKSLYRTNDTVIALDFLEKVEARGSKLIILESEASWNYYTDLTPEKRNLSVQASTRSKEFSLNASNDASKLLSDHVDLPHDIARQIRLIRRNVLPKSLKDIQSVEKLLANMTATYSSGRVCRKNTDQKTVCLDLEPDLGTLMARSRDYDELLWAWRGWRDAVGPPIRDQFHQLVGLLDQGAREHNWGDYGHFMRSVYEMGNDLCTTLKSLWSAVKPLYQELHAYVRHQLHKKYPKISSDGPIEAHLLGNMWAQDWSEIYDIVTPFPKVSPLDVTPSLAKQQYTPKKMFELAQSFFVSIGLEAMPASFWEKSVLSKPVNRSIVCHASAWGFEPNDVRIKMCTRMNQNDLIISHHEMGHCEYFLAYKNQPYAYRDGANPGFHEAIGDTIALSVETPKYLKSVGLLYSIDGNDEATINFLLMQALRRVAPLPFTYLVDQWRWRVFAGKVEPSDYNAEWWKMRMRYQGVASPVARTEKDFDPGAKFHIASNSAYIREMLEAGSSKPWPQILYRLTGEREMTASALLEYFEPLKKWLFTYRQLHKYQLGWKKPMRSHDAKGVKKTTMASGNANERVKLPDLETAMEEMQPDRHVKKSDPSLIAPKSSIEAAKPMFLPNKVKDQMNLG